MNIKKFETREAWEVARFGKITGSKLGDIVVKRGTGQKKGFYELIAERIGVPADGEVPRERGARLESEACARFEKETGKKLDTGLVIWERDENTNIAISPDAMVVDQDNNFDGTEAVEVKCLNSASHLEAYITKEIPKEYNYQKLQYFITDDMLTKLHFVFYDPRIPTCDYFVIEVTRAEVQAEVDEYLEYQRNILKLVDEWVEKLTF